MLTCFRVAHLAYHAARRIHACILQKNGHRESPFQASIQSLHGGAPVPLSHAHAGLNFDRVPTSLTFFFFFQIVIAIA